MSYSYLYQYEHPIGPTNPHNSPDGRARALLFRYLTQEQKRTYLYGGEVSAGCLIQAGNVVVEAQSGTRYLVGTGHCYSLRMMLSGRLTLERHYCAYPQNVPSEERLLAKILALKYREKQFLAVAK
jgi:hypothetical protein